MEYPKHIVDIIDTYCSKSVFYMLEIIASEEIPLYKFGISTQCETRIRTHCRKLGIKRVVKIFDCTFDSAMRNVENRFKKYAKSVGMLVKRFDQTEIILTGKIDEHVIKIEEFVKIELAKQHPENKRNVVLEKEVVVNDTNEKNKCYSCGKQFKTQAHFNQHKNRKTPCLIREIKPEDINNPNRCIYCNNIFSKKENLTRHLTNCKIKNGGLQILHDKVKPEDQLRILQEKFKLKCKEFEGILSAMQKQLDANKIEIQELRRIQSENNN
jgi:hypothetical protein